MIMIYLHQAMRERSLVWTFGGDPFRLIQTFWFFVFIEIATTIEAMAGSAFEWQGKTQQKDRDDKGPRRKSRFGHLLGTTQRAFCRNAVTHSTNQLRQ